MKRKSRDDRGADQARCVGSPPVPGERPTCARRGTHLMINAESLRNRPCLLVDPRRDRCGPWSRRGAAATRRAPRPSSGRGCTCRGNSREALRRCPAGGSHGTRTARPRRRLPRRSAAAGSRPRAGRVGTRRTDGRRGQHPGPDEGLELLPRRATIACCLGSRAGSVAGRTPDIGGRRMATCRCQAFAGHGEIASPLG
jgi:hypothetical protein